MSTLCEVGKESPFKPSLEEAAIPEEDAKSKVSSDTDLEVKSTCAMSLTGASESGCDGISELGGNLITQSVMEEEGKLEQAGEEEEEKTIQERKKLWLHMEQESKEERYRRLQCLLMKSNMYTEYLLRRMERQKEEERKRRENQIKKAVKQEQKEKEKKQEQDETTPGSESGKSSSSQSPEKKTRGKLSLRAPVAKSSLSIKSSSAGSTPECSQTPVVEAAKYETEDANKSSSIKVEEQPVSPTSDKENEPLSKKKAANIKAPDFEDFESTLREELGDTLLSEEMASESVESENPLYKESKRGRKRKQLDYNECSPQGAKLLTHFFQSSNKKRKVEEESNKQKENSIQNNTVNKTVPEPEVLKNEPDIEADGTITRPALFTGGSLRQYQVEGLNWLKVLFENGVNGMLADEMGLGKTIQCVALISQIVAMGSPGPFLVVAPLSTLPNWKMEFNRFAPRLPVVFYHGSKDERGGVLRQIRKKHTVLEKRVIQPVVITSYEMAMNDRPVLKNFQWSYLIVDEGHRLKNKNCRLIRELKEYKNAHRLLLTGTPLQNNLSELWSLLNFILPEIFDDLGSFEMWFDVEAISDESADEAIIEEERKKNILGMLHQILTPFMLRRVKADVDLQIPPKKELLVYAPLSQLQLDLYKSTVDRTILKKLGIEEEKEEKPVELDAKGRPKRNGNSLGTSKRRDSTLDRGTEVNVSLNNIMMQLRKICNHPYLIEYPLNEYNQYKIDEEVVSKCGKMMMLDKMLPELRRRGHKVLLFSQMTKMLDILEDYLCLRNIDFCRLDGSCKVEDRQQSMQQFNTDPNLSVFLLSTRAGGLGINLTGADTVIIYDSDWNPQGDLQAQDRCHRIGQTKPVVVYRFVTANTIDQKIVERAAGKRKLERMIIHKGKFKSGLSKDFSSEMKPLCPKELMQLLKSKDHCGVIKKGEMMSSEDLEALLDRSDLLEEYQQSMQKQKEEQGKKKDEKVK